MLQQAIQSPRGKFRVRPEIAFNNGDRPRKNHAIPANDAFNVLFRLQTTHKFNLCIKKRFRNVA
jgi:hypothetical protein